ncbi:MAG: hypothetical protein GY732_07145 [Gammaproteobacteria bacterium]|nr:hypothetical protein [Gammaproteobacteria bacterium]
MESFVMARFSFRNILIQRGITPEERRGVLEDLFVFGKNNQKRSITGSIS